MDGACSARNCQTEDRCRQMTHSKNGQMAASPNAKNPEKLQKCQFAFLVDMLTLFHLMICFMQLLNVSVTASQKGFPDRNAKNGRLKLKLLSPLSWLVGVSATLCAKPHNGHPWCESLEQKKNGCSVSSTKVVGGQANVDFRRHLCHGNGFVVTAHQCCAPTLQHPHDKQTTCSNKEPTLSIRLIFTTTDLSSPMDVDIQHATERVRINQMIW